jgi:hypothetical protein
VGILAGDTLYVSGQGGFDSKTKTIPDNFEDEVRSCLNNVGAVLQAGGGVSHRYGSVPAHEQGLYGSLGRASTNAHYARVSKLPGAGAHIEITGDGAEVVFKRRSGCLLAKDAQVIWGLCRTPLADDRPACAMPSASSCRKYVRLGVILSSNQPGRRY